uniref:Trout C-polysaccharide binding protein 1, isoform 3 n=1 Tax=Oncorhynchus mykiss TaxID=8022 RepID=A0A1C4HD30_ONCMY|nr:trout C-polysaccharide binding protein 1, isoform 3 [Oncorhynchus mykiss]
MALPCQTLCLHHLPCAVSRQMIPPTTNPSLITAVTLSLPFSLACLPRWGT